MTGDPVEARAFAAFDRRLHAGSRAPLAAAVSGGGDSMALLGLADAWARRAGRELRVFTVNHGLNPDSGRWTAFVADAAARLGRPAEVLRWGGDKPASGLPAAAREARHALLADAARAAGARVILMGHTAEDVAEGEVMRAEGTTLGTVREWGPSPAWPEGRGVFLLRPLLGVRRAELRAWLDARGEGWIEDPSNIDRRFGRTRARDHLSAHPRESGGPRFLAPPTEKSLGPGFRRDERVEGFGGLVISREALAGGAAALLSAALLCAGGGTRPPRGRGLTPLMARMGSTEAFTATLAGARVAADEVQVLIGREPGRGGLPALPVEPRRAAVWDGRFEVEVAERAVVRALAGCRARLAPGDQAALKAVPAPLRPALPVVETPSGAVYCPLFTMPAQARSLVAERWLSACGAFTREQDVPR